VICPPAQHKDGRRAMAARGMRHHRCEVAYALTPSAFLHPPEVARHYAAYAVSQVPCAYGAYAAVITHLPACERPTCTQSQGRDIISSLDPFSISTLLPSKSELSFHRTELTASGVCRRSSDMLYTYYSQERRRVKYVLRQSCCQQPRSYHAVGVYRRQACADFRSEVEVLIL
jgi:hypothetical protein